MDPQEPSLLLDEQLSINDLEYFELPGLNVVVAHDFYPEGHQGGVGIIQHGLRVATNGDLRLEPTPGQWSPVPKLVERRVDRSAQEISFRAEYPDEARNRRGFNPIDYPDLYFGYTVRVRAEGKAFRIYVDLDEPLPEAWIEKVGFNIELFPGILFGKTYTLDQEFGIFPRQPNGPGHIESDGEYQITPLAKGRKLVIAPESPSQRLHIESVQGGKLELIDGRGRHNNGWFVVRSVVTGQETSGALEWLVTPNIIPDWKSMPVVQVSQVGYHPNQPKQAIVELDRLDEPCKEIELLRIEESGEHKAVLIRAPEHWGRFLRYNYLWFDFSKIRRPGMYVVSYGAQRSLPFQISEKVFERHVWQPTVEYFLPVQMCHMRVSENYRVWHGACHLDDARMAPTDFNHIDGYKQGSSTLTNFSGGHHVPGLDRGGWHDAGDYDLRVESQTQTVHGLALAYESFDLQYDNTTIDQATRTVELHRPDGKPDVLQQVEHGVLTVVGSYRSLGRLYRGIIEPTVRQYTHLGDAATMTDNLKDTDDDRLVFTEENSAHELQAAAALAAAHRVLKAINEPLANECLQIAMELWAKTVETSPVERVSSAVELLQTTNRQEFAQFLLDNVDAMCSNAARFGGLAARSLPLINDPTYTEKVRNALRGYREELDRLAQETPYGVPYEPHIWGAGWQVQHFGVQQFWLHTCCPDLFPSDFMLHALNFVLGCHPGSNTATFVSGVGAKSMIPGYGVNRADESYIPGGIASGTALIRPDFPELLEWPYLWQQTEYCVGSSTADYVFLVAAAHSLLTAEKC